MCAAVRRRDRVAIGMNEAVVFGEPGDRPFERAVAALAADLAGKSFGGDAILLLDFAGEIIGEAAGEAECRLRRYVGSGLDQFLSAFPADFDAAEEVGLGARHPE